MDIIREAYMGYARVLFDGAWGIVVVVGAMAVVLLAWCDRHKD